ncbi:MAG: ORC-CDC6 family AAA ATPase, partial [Candidatus Hodarchaeales archaeon]
MNGKISFAVDPKEIQNILGNTQTERIQNDNLILDYFTHPDDYQKIFNKIPAVLDGVRGTGKSMFLRYFQIGNQTKFIEEYSHWRIIPVYFQINEQFFVHFQPGNFKDQNRFAEVLRHFFHLNIILLLLDLLLKNKELAKRRSKFQRELKNFLLKCQILHSEADNASKNLKTFKEFCENARHNLIETLRKWRLDELKYDRCLTFFDGSSFIFDFFKLIKLFLLKNEHSSLFILLDEYDRLNEYQQSVINSLVKTRDNNVTFKLACKTGTFFKNCFPDQTIDTIHDI